MFNRLLCWMFGHRQMYVHQTFGPGSRRIKCDACGGDWGMCDAVQIVLPWDRDMEDLYRRIGYRILK
jgi:hypothetical protein